jgi:hypothetical protein
MFSLCMLVHLLFPFLRLVLVCLFSSFTGSHLRIFLFHCHSRLDFDFGPPLSLHSLQTGWELWKSLVPFSSPASLESELMQVFILGFFKSLDTIKCVEAASGGACRLGRGVGGVFLTGLKSAYIRSAWRSGFITLLPFVLARILSVG